jgi:hypothetical protein
VSYPSIWLARRARKIPCEAIARQHCGWSVRSLLDGALPLVRNIGPCWYGAIGRPRVRRWPGRATECGAHQRHRDHDRQHRHGNGSRPAAAHADLPQVGRHTGGRRAFGHFHERLAQHCGHRGTSATGWTGLGGSGRSPATVSSGAITRSRARASRVWLLTVPTRQSRTAAVCTSVRSSKYRSSEGSENKKDHTA